VAPPERDGSYFGEHTDRRQREDERERLGEEHAEFVTDRVGAREHE
jgi:hypothetical protein